MKNFRQAAILQVISSVDVETQYQLIEELKKRGVKSTQATVSRDIKEMHLQKEPTPQGSYRYAAGLKQSAGDYSARLKSIFRDSVTSVASAQNIVVIKTLPGLANGACSAIDGMQMSSVVGTLAGDDTAFLAMRDSATAELLCKEIEYMLDQV
jgi:transcriptional regulator of arginine metabolism